MCESVPSSGSESNITSKINKIEHIDIKNPKFMNNINLKNNQRASIPETNKNNKL